MKKLTLLGLAIVLLLAGSKASAATTGVHQLYFTNINATNATVNLDPNSDYQVKIKAGTKIKVQWRIWMCGDDPTTAPYTACPAIYIEPSTVSFDYNAKGEILPVVLTNLKSDTKYRVWIGYDNGTRCITTPCPSDTWTDELYSFTTTAADVNPFPNVSLLSKKLMVGSRGAQVTILESFLKNQNYMNNHIDDYYGTVTRAAVKRFQRDHDLNADGIVGIGTRAVINQMLNS